MIAEFLEHGVLLSVIYVMHCKYLVNTRNYYIELYVIPYTYMYAHVSLHMRAY